jgi:hypothetical protein
MRESTKASVHAGLAIGHLACCLYHFKHGAKKHALFHAVVFTYDLVAVFRHSHRAEQESINDQFERLRLVSAECSGLWEQDEETMAKVKVV